VGATHQRHQIGKLSDILTMDLDELELGFAVAGVTAACTALTRDDFPMRVRPTGAPLWPASRAQPLVLSTRRSRDPVDAFEQPHADPAYLRHRHHSPADRVPGEGLGRRKSGSADEPAQALKRIRDRAISAGPSMTPILGIVHST